MFIMPHLNNQNTKSLQLSALRTSRVAAACSYSKLIDNENTIRIYFPAHGNNQRLLFITNIDTNYPSHDESMNFHGPSLARTTIVTYGGQSDFDSRHLHTRTGVDGKLFSYDPANPSYTIFLM